MFFKDNRDNRDNFLGCKIFVSIVSIVFKHHQQAWPCCCLKIINKLGLAVVLKSSTSLALLLSLKTSLSFALLLSLKTSLSFALLLS